MDALIQFYNNANGPLSLSSIAKLLASLYLRRSYHLECESKGKPVGFKTCVIITKLPAVYQPFVSCPISRRCYANVLRQWLRVRSRAG